MVVWMRHGIRVLIDNHSFYVLVHNNIVFIRQSRRPFKNHIRIDRVDVLRNRRKPGGTIVVTQEGSENDLQITLVCNCPSDFKVLIQKLDARCTFEESYRIGKMIGEGIQSMVFRCSRNGNPEKEFAVKFIRKEEGNDLEQRMSAELSVFLMVEHPNIVRVMDVFDDDQSIIIVMEFVSSGDLFDFINENGPLTNDQCATIFRQLLLAVQYLHRMRIVHRDIKLENILIDSESLCIKLIDFGLSKIQDCGQPLQTPCGSPNYAAPEIINGDLYTRCVDVWSIGVSMFTALAQRYPFDSNNTMSIYRAIQNDDIVFPPFISNGARYAIQCMMQKDPIKRPTVQKLLKMPFFKGKRSLSSSVPLQERISIKNGNLTTESSDNV